MIEFFLNHWHYVIAGVLVIASVSIIQLIIFLLEKLLYAILNLQSLKLIEKIGTFYVLFPIAFGFILSALYPIVLGYWLNWILYQGCLWLVYKVLWRAGLKKILQLIKDFKK